MNGTCSSILLAGALALGAAVPGARAQGNPLASLPAEVVVPQRSAFSLSGGASPVEVAGVTARVTVEAQVALTELEIELRNTGPRDAEAVLLLPVPGAAVVRSFAFEGPALEPTAELLPAEEARRLYDSIVARIRDPALLEFAGYRSIRTSVFPVPAGGGQRVRIGYEEILPADGDRVDYFLPRSEALSAAVPWNIEVRVHARAPLTAVYSPSHPVHVTAPDPRRCQVFLAKEGAAAPGSFRLSWMTSSSGPSASVFAYPSGDAAGGGYFLLLVGLPPGAALATPRDVTLVLDCSGSMAGAKMEQARAAAERVLAGLTDADTFHLVAYSTGVSSFARAPVPRTAATLEQARQYLEALRPHGGTNLHDALLEALRSKPPAGALPLVLLLSDGIPTIGKTDEDVLTGLVQGSNPFARRVFPVGLGADVNVPLLDRIADSTRALATYVFPEDDVVQEVAGLAQKLRGPTFTDAVLTAADPADPWATSRIQDCLPAMLPDLFGAEPLVVLGRYQGEGRVTFRLSGKLRGSEQSFSFPVDFAGATTRNAFVPRLWASRQIAVLVDEARRLGAAGPPAPGTQSDPRLAELTGEILRLSTEFGILTEYTAFLAREGSDLSDWETLRASCASEVWQQAVSCRSGWDAVSQGRNYNERKLQAQWTTANRYWNPAGQQVEPPAVQQVCDRAFYGRGGAWIDARLVGDAAPADEVIPLDSARHRELRAELRDEGREALLSLSGDVFLEHQGKKLWIRNTLP